MLIRIIILFLFYLISNIKSINFLEKINSKLANEFELLVPSNIKFIHKSLKMYKVYTIYCRRVSNIWSSVLYIFVNTRYKQITNYDSTHLYISIKCYI